jgi:hypothetical protein
MNGFFVGSKSHGYLGEAMGTKYDISKVIGMYYIVFGLIPLAFFMVASFTFHLFLCLFTLALSFASLAHSPLLADRVAFWAALALIVWCVLVQMFGDWDRKVKAYA